MLAVFVIDLFLGVYACVCVRAFFLPPLQYGSSSTSRGHTQNISLKWGFIEIKIKYFSRFEPGISVI